MKKEQLQERIDELEQENSDLQDKVDELENDVDSLEADIRNLESDIEDLEDENDELKGQVLCDNPSLQDIDKIIILQELFELRLVDLQALLDISKQG